MSIEALLPSNTVVVSDANKRSCCVDWAKRHVLFDSLLPTPADAEEALPDMLKYKQRLRQYLPPWAYDASVVEHPEAYDGWGADRALTLAFVGAALLWGFFIAFAIFAYWAVSHCPVSGLVQLPSGLTVIYIGFILLSLALELKVLQHVVVSRAMRVAPFTIFGQPLRFHVWLPVVMAMSFVSHLDIITTSLVAVKALKTGVCQTSAGSVSVIWQKVIEKSMLSRMPFASNLFFIVCFVWALMLLQPAYGLMCTIRVGKPKEIFAEELDKISKGAKSVSSETEAVDCAVRPAAAEFVDEGFVVKKGPRPLDATHAARSPDNLTRIEEVLRTKEVLRTSDYDGPFEDILSDAGIDDLQTLMDLGHIGLKKKQMEAMDAMNAMLREHRGPAKKRWVATTVCERLLHEIETAKALQTPSSLPQVMAEGSSPKMLQAVQRCMQIHQALDEADFFATCLVGRQTKPGALTQLAELNRMASITSLDAVYIYQGSAGWHGGVILTHFQRAVTSFAFQGFTQTAAQMNLKISLLALSKASQQETDFRVGGHSIDFLTTASVVVSFASAFYSLFLAWSKVEKLRERLGAYRVGRVRCLTQLFYSMVVLYMLLVAHAAVKFVMVLHCEYGPWNIFGGCLILND